MTAQIEDIFCIDGQSFDIIAETAPITFSPEEYGFSPTPICTACWSGYWCEYGIQDNRLCLDKLYISNTEDIYPDLNGVSVSPVEYEDCTVYTRGETRIESYPKYMGHRLYAGIALPIKYTGRILVGADFLNEYYIHMGFQHPYAYKTLLEFCFEDGVLMMKTDYSDFGERLRAKIDLGDPSWKYDGADLWDFIENSFSLDYSEKCWWMHED